jgi:hypothetical protein
MSSPSQVSQFTDLSICRLDIETSKTRFQKDPKKFINVGIFKENEKTFKTIIKGTLTTDGANEAKFDKKKAYSMGIEFDDAADIIGFEKLTAIVQDFCGPEFTVKSPVKDDDRYYIKIKEPKKVAKACRDQKVTVLGELKVWINVDNMTGGISFDAINFEFEEL